MRLVRTGTTHETGVSRRGRVELKLGFLYFSDMRMFMHVNKTELTSVGHLRLGDSHYRQFRSFLSQQVSKCLVQLQPTVKTKRSSRSKTDTRFTKQKLRKLLIFISFFRGRYFLSSEKFIHHHCNFDWIRSICLHLCKIQSK